MSEIINIQEYNKFLIEIKKDIQTSQQKAISVVNTQMIMLYYKIGQMIDIKQSNEGWGAKVIKRLSSDIKNELPEIKGFSQRNITRMLKFYKEYQSLSTIVPQLVAQNNKLLIQSENKVVAEYSLKNMTQPIGISEYELTEVLPSDFESVLPTIDTIEEEMENIIFKEDDK